MTFLDAFTDDLRRPEYQRNPNPLAGHCYVMAEVIHHFNPDAQPWFIRHEGEPHWFLYDPKANKVLDLTASQFKTPVPYSRGMRKGFLTIGPSKRAQVVIDRLRAAA